MSFPPVRRSASLCHLNADTLPRGKERYDVLYRTLNEIHALGALGRIQDAEEILKRAKESKLFCGKTNLPPQVKEIDRRARQIFLNRAENAVRYWSAGTYKKEMPFIDL